MTAGSLNINNFIPTALKDEINKSFLGQFLKTPKPTRPNHDDGGLKRRASAPDLTDANTIQNNNNEESEHHFQADALKATAMAEKRRVRRQSGHFSPGGVARRPNRRIRNVDSGTSSGGGRSDGDGDDDSTSSFDDLLVPFPNFDDLVVVDPSGGPTRSGVDAGQGHAHDNHASTSTSTSIPKNSLRHGGSGHSSSNSSGRRRSRHNDDKDNKDNNKRKSSSRMSCSERLSSSRRDPDFRLSSTSNHSDKHQHRRSGLRRGKSDQQLLSSRSSRHRDSRRSGGASMSSSLHSSAHSGKNHRDSYNYRRSSSSRRLSTKDKGESLDALGSGRPCSASATTCSSITGNSTTGNSFASESRTSSSHKREAVGTSSSHRRSSDKTSRRSSDKSPRRSSGGGGGVAMDKSERRSSAAMDKSDRRSSSRMDKSDRRSSSRMDKSDRRSSAAMDKSDRRMDRSDRRSSGMDKKSKSDRRLDKSERRSSATTTKDKSERRSSARDRSPKRQSEKSERRTSASHNNSNNNNNPKSPRRSSDKSSRRSSTSHNGFRSSTGTHISTPQLDVIASPRRNSDKLPPKTPKKTTNTPKTPNKQQKRHPPQRRRGSTGSTQEDGSGHSGVLREFYGSMMSPIYNSNEAGFDQSGTSTSHSGAASDDPWGEVDDGRMQERRASKSSTRRDSRSKSTPRGSKTPKSGKTPRSSKTDRPGVVRLREGLERVAGVINNRDDDFMLPPLIQLTPDDNLSADIVSLDALDLEDGSVNGKGKSGRQRSRPPQHGSKKALSKSRHGALGGIDEESAHLPKETSPSKRRPSDIHFWDSLGNVDQEVSESKLFDSMVW